MKTIGLNHLLLLVNLALVSACNGVGTAQFDEAAVGTGNATDTSLVFSGLNSVTDKTDSTVTLHWTAHANAVSYVIYKNGSYLKTLDGQANSQASLTGLTPSSTYSFRVRMKTSADKTDGNTTDSVLVMNAAPNVPSVVSLQAPSYTPALVPTPTIRVSGVKTGDTVKLFTDSNCTTQVATGVATGSTIDLVTSSLAAGAYTFYANSTNSIPSASACSTASVAYTRNACPAGYVSVVHNAALGTSTDFCVAKYEMKCSGTSCPTGTPGANAVAASVAAGTPWVSITQTNSKTACTNLNAINGVVNKYALISNPEWMTIARDLERVDFNWSSGNAAVGVLARGHTDNIPTNALAASTDNDPYSGTNGNSAAQAANAGWEQKRTHTLSNGEVIWDFAGNVWDWVDWQVTPANKAYVAATPIATDQGWKEFSALNTKITGADEMKPETWQSFYSTLTGSEGIGRYYAGINSSGGAALRGGHWNHGTYAGAFTLSLSASAGDSVTSLGFRCVYRP